MSFEKELFLEDLKGLNGKVAQDLALEEVSNHFDRNFGADEISDLECDVSELENENDELNEEVEELKKKIVALRRRNHLLKRENFTLGNILDGVVIQKGIDVYDISLD